ncbi:ParA family protein [Virgibacillus kimchii]
MKTMLISNYKGGTGKSKSSLLFSYLIKEKRYKNQDNKVLFIDFDSQMNATEVIAKDFSQEQLAMMQTKNIFEAIKNDNLVENIIQGNIDNLDVVPGHPNTNLFHTLMSQKGVTENQFLYFKFLLKQVEEYCDYDFIVMDMSPSKSPLNLAVMAAADYHVVLTQAEILSINMIDNYLKDIHEIQEASKFPSEILGIAVSMKDRYKHSQILLEKLKEKYGSLVFDSVIKRKSLLNQYSITGFPKKKQNGEFYAKDRTALTEYKNLTDEILNRIEVVEKKGKVR